jgi:hypothetical protein
MIKGESKGIFDSMVAIQKAEAMLRAKLLELTPDREMRMMTVNFSELGSSLNLDAGSYTNRNCRKFFEIIASQIGKASYGNIIDRVKRAIKARKFRFEGAYYSLSQETIGYIKDVFEG